MVSHSLAARDETEHRPDSGGDDQHAGVAVCEEEKFTDHAGHIGLAWIAHQCPPQPASSRVNR